MKKTDLAIFAVGIFLLFGAYCAALASVDAERNPPAGGWTAESCHTDWECAQTPECMADPQCDGGPY